MNAGASVVDDAPPLAGGVGSRHEGIPFDGRSPLPPRRRTTTTQKGTVGRVAGKASARVKEYQSILLISTLTLGPEGNRTPDLPHTKRTRYRCATSPLLLK